MIMRNRYTAAMLGALLGGITAFFLTNELAMFVLGFMVATSIYIWIDLRRLNREILESIEMLEGLKRIHVLMEEITDSIPEEDFT